MALAKLLKSENIQGVLRIKYKNPTRVLVQFGNRENAEKLLSNKKFRDLDYRCHMTKELNLSYGIVKHIDLDMKEEEMMESFECDVDIISVRRLKRFTEEGKWEPSKTVRFCFNSNYVPSFVYGYGCRFAVNKYIFPVSQCSKCWKYGHLSRSCPARNPVCPKCGANHDNCELKIFVCVNCSGNHMALDKSCPIFKKEKMLREIMSQDNCTYRVALASYLKNIEDKKKSEPVTSRNIVISKDDKKEKLLDFGTSSYRDKLLTNIDIGRESSPILPVPSTSGKKRNTAKKYKQGRKIEIQQKAQTSTQEESASETCYELPTEEREPRKSDRRYELKKLLYKIKDICVSNLNFEDKICSVIKFVFEEFKEIIVSFLKSGKIVESLLGILCNG